MNQVSFYIGIMIIVAAVAVWIVFPDRRSQKNVIKFLGFEFTLNTPAIAVAVIGIILIVLSRNNPRELLPHSDAKGSDDSAVADPALVLPKAPDILQAAPNPSPIDLLSIEAQQAKVKENPYNIQLCYFPCSEQWLDKCCERDDRGIPCSW